MTPKTSGNLSTKHYELSRKGEKFFFLDKFQINQLYGDINNLIEIIKSWGIDKVEYVQARDAEFIPTVLKTPFILGPVDIIKGEK